MAEWGILYQNLIDAGCDEKMARRCLSCIKKKETAEYLRLLSRHRKSLLDMVHENQKKIDCLDYLLFQIGKDCEI